MTVGKRKGGAARIAATGLAAVLLLTACSGGDDDNADGNTNDADSAATSDTGEESISGPGDAGSTSGPDDAETTSGPDDAEATSGPGETGAAPELPGGALGEQTAWILEMLEPDASGPDEQEAQEHFASGFLDEVPADQIEPILQGVRDSGELTLVAVTEETPSPGSVGQVSLRLDGAEPQLVTLAVDEDDLISGLRLTPDISATAPQLETWEEVDAGLADPGATSQVFIADVSDGVCEPVHETPDSEPAPSGSVFKLIVLSAVVDAVAEGDLAWDEELTITPELKSLPSGQLQDEEDGSTVTVQEAAELMIAISDNTGTDLLMDAVGEERLAASVAAVSDDPDRLTPLLTTRQFFLLGWGAPEVSEPWGDADPQQRVDLLTELPDDLATLNPLSVTTPAWTEGVGWFLTGEEICATHALLQEQAETEAGAPLRDILSANPGLVPPAEVTYQGFKGGNAPGVLAMTFYVETEEDVSRVVSVQVRHDGAIYPDGFNGLVQSALNLAATGQ